MSGGKGGSGSGQKEGMSAPWQPQQPYILGGLNQASNLYGIGPQGATQPTGGIGKGGQSSTAGAGTTTQPGSPLSPNPSTFQTTPYGPQYYPGQTYAQPTQAQTQGLQQVANLGLGGTDVGNAASNAVTGVLNGSPAMDQSIFARVQPQIQSQFSAGNRLDSGLATRALGSGLSDAILQNQLSYAQLAPQLNNMQIGGAQAAAQAGAGQQNLQQQGINDLVQRWNYNQQLPYSNLNNYMNLVGNPYGSTSATKNATGQKGGALGPLAEAAAVFAFL